MRAPAGGGPWPLRAGRETEAPKQEGCVGDTLEARGLQAQCSGTQSLSWEDPDPHPHPRAAPLPTFTPGVPGSRPAVNAWGSLLSRKLKGDSTMGRCLGSASTSLCGGSVQVEVGLVSLGSPSSQLGEQNGSGKGFQEMDDSPSLVWVMSVSRPSYITTLFTGEKTRGTERGHFKVTEPAHWPQSSV